jgi:hypothetical protein
MMAGSNDLLDAALAYAARAWPVFPCEPGGKRPLGRLAPHGLKDATDALDLIEQMWKAEPTANIGLPTGIHFDVLDIDSADALARFDAAMPLASDPDDDELVEGPTVQTPRGHHVYVAPSGHGNTVNLGGLPGVDWRGEGGYVIGPPSRRADGATWSWITGTPFDLGPDTPIIPAPAWVLALFEHRVQPRVVSPGPVPKPASSYGLAALEREVGRVAMALEGSRNDQLNRSAHALGQLIAGGALPAEAVAAALLDAALGVGLTETEAIATIRSGLVSGACSPRRVPT